MKPYVTGLIALLLLMLFVATAPLPAADELFIGGLRNVQGSAWVIRGEETLPAAEGLRIRHNDRLKTGADGALGIVFLDDTRISLGPNSELTVDRYVYEPAQGLFNLVARLYRGTAAYLSGAIGKLSPESVQFKTPTATIGVRGTSFLVDAGGG